MNTRDMLWTTSDNGYKTNSEKTQCPVMVNNYQTGIDSFIKLLHEASHSHKNNKAAHNVTEVEHNPRNEGVHAHTNNQEQSD